MPTAETVPPQYSPGDVVATSDGVEWLIEAITATTADLVRFKDNGHDRKPRTLVGLKLLRKGDLRQGRPPLDVLKKSNYWWVYREGVFLSIHNVKVDGDRAFYDYAPFTPNSFHPLTPEHATASYCPANAAGVPLPWSSLDVAAPTSQQQSAQQLSAATSDTVTKPPITTATEKVKETTMPPTTTPTPTADTLSSRFVAALKEGARRAPVEAGIDKGHEMLKELLISAVPAEGPREEGIIREYVTRLLSSNYGKAIGAYAVGELLHTVAPHLGKRAALAQAAGREFAFRAATIAEKEAGSSIIALFPKGISMLDDLLNSFAGSDSEVEVAAVQPQQLSGSTGELSRVMAAAVGGAASAEKVAV